MRILYFLCSFVVFIGFPLSCTGQEKILAKTAPLYEACMNRCNRSDTLGVLTFEGCLKGCEESRRTFSLRNKKYSSYSQCLRDMETIEINRDLLIEEAQEWCTEQWLHLHKRKGCKDAVYEFYTAAIANNICWNAPHNGLQQQSYISPQPLYEGLPTIIGTNSEVSTPSLTPLTDASIQQQYPSVPASEKRKIAPPKKKIPVSPKQDNLPASIVLAPTNKAPQKSNATEIEQIVIPPSPSQKTLVPVPPLASGALSLESFQQENGHALPLVPTAEGTRHDNTPLKSLPQVQSPPMPHLPSSLSGTVNDALLSPPTPGIGI